MTPKPSPRYFYVQRPFEQFWSDYDAARRRVLFICGLGFDPRCVSAMKAAARVFRETAERLETVCLRFTNLWDEHVEQNLRYTEDCLEQIRSVTHSLEDPRRFQHVELEVNIFAEDERRLIGDQLLLSELDDLLADHFSTFTDVVVDISAFPRTLMYSVLGKLWRERSADQNLFAVLTEVKDPPRIDESNYTEPGFMLSDRPPAGSDIIWIPVLGGRIERFEKIYSFLQPKDVLPIVPFPSRNPRAGDEIILAARQHLFERWDVPFDNVMYASGDVPFDVFRKIEDIVADYRDFKREFAMVVSALSGRSLSLGVLLAALRLDLPICHAQPTTYYISDEERRKLASAAETAQPTLFWLDGQLYRQ